MVKRYFCEYSLSVCICIQSCGKMCDLCAEIAKQLFHPELKYADVIASFRKLPSEKREEITKKHSSFVDWITSSCNQLDGGDEVDFTYLVHKVVSEKINIGLTAIGAMKICEIQTTLMHTTGFVSDGLLARILGEFPEFTVTRSASGDLVKLSECSQQTKKIAIPLPSRKEDPIAEDRRKEQLKVLFREEPDVVACFSLEISWGIIAKAHSFWIKRCAASSPDLTDWLTCMAKTLASSTYPEYVKALRACIFKRCFEFVKSKPRTIKQLLALLCVTMERITSEYFVYAACCENDDLVTIEKPEVSAAMSQFVVSLKGFEPKVQATVTPVPCTAESAPTPSDPFRFPFSLPADCLSKLNPLLTCKATYTSLVRTYDALRQTHPKVMEKAVSVFGCFLAFLLQFFKHAVKSGDSEAYGGVLSRQLTILVCQKLYAAENRTVTWTDMIENLAPSGFADSKVIYQTLDSNKTRFLLANGEVAMIEENRITSSGDRTLNVRSLVNHPRLNALHGDGTTFDDLLQAYSGFSKEEKTLLAMQGKTFVSLLEDCFRTWHPGKFYVHRKHVNQLIFREVLSLVESRYSIQLPLAHRMVTKGNPGFLSPDEILYSLRISPAKVKFIEGVLMLCGETSTSRRPVSEQRIHEGLGQAAVSVEVWTSQAVHSILRSRVTCQDRMADILALEHSLSEEMRRALTASYGTFCHFINTSVTESALFRVIVNREACVCLEDRTMLSSDLLLKLFGNRPSFMSELDLVETLDPDEFVVLKYDRSNLVANVRVGFNGRVQIRDESEKMVVETVLSLFLSEGCTLSFDIMYTRVSSSMIFTKLQRLFLFGTPEGELPGGLSEVHFRRFLLMYPSLFRIHEQDVLVASSHLSPPRPSRSPPGSPVTRSCGSERESGEVSECDSAKKHRKRGGSSKKSGDAEGRAKKRKRRHRTRSKSRAGGGSKPAVASELEPGSIQEIIASLPLNLIQDVTLGRLLAAEENQMSLKELVECLTTSLLNATQRTLVTDDDEAGDSFKSKILESLETAEQVQIQGASDGAPRLVKLVLKAANKREKAAHVLAPVFRHASSLTGVKSKDLCYYIRALADIQGGDMDVETVIGATKRKYSKSKANPDLSDDVIACQVVGCLLHDAQMRLDPVEATCCLDRARNSGGDSLLNCLGSVAEDEVSDYILQYLKDEANISGCTIAQLALAVSQHFGTRLDSASDGTICLVTQFLVIDHDKVGFTTTGKVAALGDIVPDNDVESPKFSDSEVATSSTGLPASKGSAHSSDAARFVTPTSSTAGDVIRLEPHQQQRRDPRLHSTTGSGRSAFRHSSAKTDVIKAPERPQADAEMRETPSSTTQGYGAPSPQQQNVVSCSRESMHDARRARRVARLEKMRLFLVEFLSTRNNCSETEAVVAAAAQRFSEERFARSALALEAYVREFVALLSDLFAFGNRYGGVGVTWTFYRPHCAVTSKPELPLVGVSEELLEALQVHLLSRPGKKDSLEGLCHTAALRFAARLEAVHESERVPICRTLILIFCIRNLDKFVFSKTESVIGLRRETLERTVRSLAAPLTPMSPVRRFSEDDNSLARPLAGDAAEVSHKSKAQLRKEAAVKLLASLLASNGPCSKTQLRELWSNRADDDLRKVLGSGVSFHLDLRKFDKCFPTGDDGLVRLDELECRRFLERI